MTNLATMRARILNETGRDDLAGAIDQEIASAINFYKSTRFWFSETRTRLTFDTVIGQTDYGRDNDALIPNLIQIDYITVDYQGRRLPIRYSDPLDIELWSASSSMVRNPPARYSLYDQMIRFYPEPDGVYPVRIAGVVRVEGPVTDDEANNPWMTEAEDLIRFRAKRNLYLNNFFGTEPGEVQSMAVAEEEALRRLRAETSRRTQVHTLRPACV